MEKKRGVRISTREPGEKKIGFAATKKKKRIQVEDVQGKGPRKLNRQKEFMCRAA